jgi:hypothetical protein
VGLRAGLDDVEKRKFLTLTGLALRLLGLPARSQSLYRLSYPGSFYLRMVYTNKVTNLYMSFGYLNLYCDVHAVGNMAFVYDSCYGNQLTVETLVYNRC